MKTWLIILISVVGTVIVAGSGTYYLFGKKSDNDIKALKTQLSNLTQTVGLSNSENAVAQNTDTTTSNVPETGQSSSNLAQPTAPSSSAHDVQVTYNDNHTIATLLVDGKKIKDFNFDDYYYLNIFKQTKDSVYLEERPDGIGGYILFKVQFPVNKLDFATNVITKIGDKVGDISSSERYAASVDQANHQVVLTNLTTNSKTEYVYDAKYSQGGDVKISPNEKKIAFGATIGDPDNQKEKSDVFVIDIASNTLIKANDTVIDGTVTVLGWNDNTQVNWRKN